MRAGWKSLQNANSDQFIYNDSLAKEGRLTESLRFNAVSFAFVLCGKAVGVSSSSAEPETGTSTVFHVEEPLHCEVATRTAILIQPADIFTEGKKQTFSYTSERIIL